MSGPTGRVPAAIGAASIIRACLDALHRFVRTSGGLADLLGDEHVEPGPQRSRSGNQGVVS